MKNPKLLKSNVQDLDEAIEIMNYLYCEYIEKIEADYDVVKFYDKENNLIGKWTKEYENIMISESLLTKRED